MTENGDNCPQVWSNQGECPRISQLSQRELGPSSVSESPVGRLRVATAVQGPACAYHFAYWEEQTPQKGVRPSFSLARGCRPRASSLPLALRLRIWMGNPC